VLAPPNRTAKRPADLTWLAGGQSENRCSGLISIYRSPLIDTFASAVEVESFDEAAAAEFGRIGSMLAERGTPIGEFDVLIAAHAVTLRCTLVTNNVRHFSKVPGLSVENWA